MSQHIFEQTVNGQKRRVQLGWDKPCQMFYGIVLEWIEQDGESYWDEETPV